LDGQGERLILTIDPPATVDVTSVTIDASNVGHGEKLIASSSLETDGSLKGAISNNGPGYSASVEVPITEAPGDVSNVYVQTGHKDHIKVEGVEVKYDVLYDDAVKTETVTAIQETTSYDVSIALSLDATDGNGDPVTGVGTDASTDFHVTFDANNDGEMQAYDTGESTGVVDTVTTTETEITNAQGRILATISEDVSVETEVDVTRTDDLPGDYSDDDVMVAGEQGAVLTGGTGDDTLIGGEGDDLLIGGLGDDAIDLTAGGHDEVVVTANESQPGVTDELDTVTGFEEAEGDGTDEDVLVIEDLLPQEEPSLILVDSDSDGDVDDAQISVENPASPDPAGPNEVAVLEDVTPTGTQDLDDLLTQVTQDDDPAIP